MLSPPHIHLQLNSNRQKTTLPEVADDFLNYIVRP